VRGSIALIVVTAACYAPDVEDCQYKCNDDTGCPDGLECSPDNLCRRDPTSTTCPASACAWDYTPSNFNPCDDYAAQGGEPWDIRSNLPYDTSGDVGGTPPPLDVGNVRLIRVTTLTIAPNVTLELLGPRVVVIIADTVDIGGAIVARSGTTAIDCIAVAGGEGGSCGGGGAGGAFQGGGGGGGACSDAGGGGGSPPTVALATGLVPLRRGCDGALGGASAVGDNGAGGGGLQISARFELKVTGTGARIVAPGRGGRGGQSDSPLRNGGNGGGSGGAILLEAATLTVSSLICAEGGGGGEGMNSASSTSFGANGTDGCLAPLAPLGGASAMDGGDGGDGGSGAMLDGASGMTSTSTGGGGGGGAGVIRIHTLDPQDGSATYSPAPIIE
jgi:hypothetical protein